MKVTMKNAFELRLLVTMLIS